MACTSLYDTLYRHSIIHQAYHKRKLNELYPLGTENEGGRVKNKRGTHIVMLFFINSRKQ